MPSNGYLFVYETLLNQIESRLLTPGMQLSSEVDLARDLNVSRMTVRKALARLEEENQVFRRVGVGTFVKAVTVPVAPCDQRISIGIEAQPDWKAGRPYVTQIISETQKACSEYNCNLLLLGKEELLAGKNIDAAFFPYLELEDFSRAIQLSRRMPTALLNRITDEPELGYVAVDYVEATCRIIRRLLENGVDNILLIGGASNPERSYALFTRELGYRKAFEQMGRKVNEELVFSGRDTEQYKLVAEKLVRFKPDVVFVSCEFLMTRVYTALESHGRQLGKRVYVFSFDDMQDFTMLNAGSLSYGRMPFGAMCARAVEHLSGRVRKTVPNEPVHEIFPMSYVITECPFLI